MSHNRENVIWQSPNGTWNRGFFSFVVTGPDDEWDVEYNHREFSWVATGLPNENAARDAWHGANPGGHHRLPWDEKNRTEIERYEQMATVLEHQQSKRRGRCAGDLRSPRLDREIREALTKPNKR